LEVLNNYQRKKLDESNDEEFYSDPKFVYHLDANFRRKLSDLYEREIDSYSTVLDLMSSWDSYLPKMKKYKKVIGHGLNKQELEKNKIFDSYWIQNFNLNQQIPLDEESVDYCLMVAAWQYLQYPEKLTKEIARILSRHGKFIIAFSNRAFWHKAPNIWTSSTEEERVKYVRKVLISNGFNEPKIIKEFSDKALDIFNIFNKDPFYCLIATKE
jgi:SAM-dependent methyltransferase